MSSSSLDSFLPLSCESSPAHTDPAMTQVHSKPLRLSLVPRTTVLGTSFPCCILCPSSRWSLTLTWNLFFFSLACSGPKLLSLHLVLLSSGVWFLFNPISRKKQTLQLLIPYLLYLAWAFWKMQRYKGDCFKEQKRPPCLETSLLEILGW